jgi:hypothetical protein
VKTYDNGQWIKAKITDFGSRFLASQEAARARALEPMAPGIPGVDDINRAFGTVDVSVVKEVNEQRKASPHDVSPLASAPVKGVNSHRWLESTTKFAEEMMPFWQSTVSDFVESNPKQNRPTTDGLEKDVIVALIDDGVDKFDPRLEANQVLDGKTFDFHNGMVRPYYSSTQGHGTVMASMILRVCPMAKIYPIRLKTYDDSAEGKNMTIDAGYAARVCTMTIVY